MTQNYCLWGMPIRTKDTMPEALQRKHNAKSEPGKITVLKGQLRLSELTERGRKIASHLLEEEQKTPWLSPRPGTV